MRLVMRRARAARSLLIAAVAATLIATALLTGLAGYSREVVDAGARGAVSAADGDQRSVLVRGSAGGTAADLDKRDGAVRDRLAGGLGGRRTTVSAAGYGAGRELTGPTGAAQPDKDGTVYASVVFLEGIAQKADLVAGVWPDPAAPTVQAALNEDAAAVLGVRTGDTVPILDRVSKQTTAVTVTGVWRPRDDSDAYWRLAPDADATYGPFVVGRAAFVKNFLVNASAAWLVEPDLTGAALDDLHRVADDAATVSEGLPEATGLGRSGLVTSDIGALADRLAAADLVGRSALVTPMLLVVVLSGYALLLVAGLLTEQRRDETALLRARGAARNQLAGLAAREALLVVLPAAVIAPPLATWAVRETARLPMLRDAAIELHPSVDAVAWTVAALAALGCGLAMLAPALRKGGTYAGELAARARPTRRTAIQRAGVDLLLVVLAVLGWVQLRQYTSPLSGSGDGGIGIDPLLAATPTLGVLGGAVVALRLLPPVTRLAERVVDRRQWIAATFGAWQAGRRPHAGPVLLLSLAVAVSTVAWCLASTSTRSGTDRADHATGADLRLVEQDGAAPAARLPQMATLPGAATVLPAWRDSLRMGPDNTAGDMIALDAEAAPAVLRLRPDLAGGDPDALLGGLAGARQTAPDVPLPSGAKRLTGRFTGDGVPAPIRTTVVLGGTHGATQRLLLGEVWPGREAVFDVELPAGADRLAGFVVDSVAGEGNTVTWSLTALAVDGVPLDLAAAVPRWQGADRAGRKSDASVQGAGLSTRYAKGGPVYGVESFQFTVVPKVAAPFVVPVVATPQALAALKLDVGDTTQMTLGGASVNVVFTGTVEALPGAALPAALLVDLPTLHSAVFSAWGLTRSPQEWWVAAQPGGRAEAAEAARKLGGLTVLDRVALGSGAQSDPYGVGARAALFAAAIGAVLLAAVGIAVDVRATGRRRLTEMAVLHTLGVGARQLARSLLIEQAFLGGLGVLAGLGVGIAVAATMAPLVVLTPSAERPVPEPLLEVDWPAVGLTGALLFGLALALSGLSGVGLRKHLAVAQLRIGEDR
ncbi:ABC transporter permease [Catenuloplanes sp. NPDC051500]|uniref:ABC transporter permease n=1 Tax=Catenuloplanes sp. NPDC051500 TaxID=3363959 RepID=UPI00379CB322